MKVLFVEARKRFDEFEIDGFRKEFEKLPESIFLAYSIQYKELAIKIRDLLLEMNKKVRGFSQVLGCSKIDATNVDAILLVGSGRFHALQLALSTGKDVYIFDGKICKLTKKEISAWQKKKKASLLRFYSADSIGAIVSVKHGQLNGNLSKGIDFVRRLRKLGKKKRGKEGVGRGEEKGWEKKREKAEKEKRAFVFLSDTISINELENFQIDSWVNLACPGLWFDGRVINYEDIL